MYLHIDTAQLPPVTEVREPDDLGAFKVVIAVPEHAWIGPQVLTDLAGRGNDELWQQRLAAMVEFAASRGWCDDAGRIRGHVEIRSSARTGT